MFTLVPAFFIGSLSILVVRQLPLQTADYFNLLVLMGGGGVTLLGMCIWSGSLSRNRYFLMGGQFLFGFIFGCVWGLGWSYHALGQRLPEEMRGDVLSVTGLIVSIPVSTGHSTHFKMLLNETEVERNHLAGGTLQVSWFDAPIALHAGEQWKLNLKLDVPRGEHNPGAYDVEKGYFARGIDAVGQVRQAEEARLISAATPYSFLHIRQMLFSRLGQIKGDKDAIGVVQALVVGEKSGISRYHKGVFSRMGISHLMAISGLHIGLVAGWVFLLLRNLWGRFNTASLFCPPVYPASLGAFIVALLYALLAGFSASTQRALIMVGCTLFAMISKRQIRPWLLFLYALMGVVLLDPFAALSLGFWFSFSAVALVMLVMQRWADRKRWQQMLMIQGVISVAMIPLQWYVFNQASLLSPFINLVSIPLFSCIIVPLALVTAMLLLICPVPGLWLGRVTVMLLEWYFDALVWIDVWGIGQWENATFSLWKSVLVTLLLLAALMGFRWRTRLITGCLAIGVSLYPGFHGSLAHGQFELIVWDVGQGLAAAIHTRHHLFVYDSGPALGGAGSVAERTLLPLIKRKGYSKIDTLVISHAHLDHSAGLEAFVDHLSPEHIVSGEPEKLLPGLKIDLCQAGEEWEWDGVRFEVLHPSLNEKAHWIENDASCVIRVSSGEVGVLLTGDIESASETYLTEHYADRLQSDVLVVPHHGSRTSSTPLFTQMVAPRHAIISAGYANRYRHPSPQTVKRYQENEVCVWNTALDGQVSLRVSQKGAENLRLSRLHKGRLWTLRRKQVDIGCL